MDFTEALATFAGAGLALSILLTVHAQFKYREACITLGGALRELEHAREKFKKARQMAELTARAAGKGHLLKLMVDEEEDGS